MFWNFYSSHRPSLTISEASIHIKSRNFYHKIDIPFSRSLRRCARIVVQFCATVDVVLVRLAFCLSFFDRLRLLSNELTDL